MGGSFPGVPIRGDFHAAPLYAKRLGLNHAIIAVPGIPRTLSGKKLEIPVRKILLGTPVAQAADPSALANPDMLAFFTPLETP